MPDDENLAWEKARDSETRVILGFLVYGLHLPRWLAGRMPMESLGEEDRDMKERQSLVVFGRRLAPR